jgi:hypothetical protein
MTPSVKQSALCAAFALLLLGSGCDTLGIGGEGNDQVSLFAVELDNRWGYINADGRMIIEPRFTSAGEFSDGVAAVRDGSGAYGYITPDGEYVIEPQFSGARPFREGLAPAALDGRWGYINTRGTFVINPAFTEASTFSDGRAFIRTSSWVWEYIDKSGNIIRTDETPSFGENDEAMFKDGLALVRDEGSYGYINTSTRVVIPLQYTEARSFSDGRAAIKISDRWGFIDKSRNTIIDPKYISAGSFNDGLAPVRETGNVWGYIDESGRVVIQEQYEDARSFSDRRAAVMIEGKWGFIDTGGNLVAPAMFDDVDDFKNGLARVYRFFGENERMGYIDTAGKDVWYPTD